jgi:hypothetical protein
VPRRIAHAALWVATSLAFSTPVPAQGVKAATTLLVVQVGDATSGAFIQGAEVRLTSLNRAERTRWDGEARFANVAAGKHHVQVRALGYAPGDVDIEVSGDTLPVHFSLERLAAVMDTVRVVSTRHERHMREFENRRKTGIGHYLTDSAITEHRQKGLQMLLATEVPGFMTMQDALVTGGGVGGRDCGVLFYLDGFILGQSLTPRDQFQRDSINLGAIRPEELGGIEVYSRNSAPQQYRPLGSYCKVVLMWMKR